MAIIRVCLLVCVLVREYMCVNLFVCMFVRMCLFVCVCVCTVCVCVCIKILGGNGHIGKICDGNFIQVIKLYHIYPLINEICNCFYGLSPHFPVFMKNLLALTRVFCTSG